MNRKISSETLNILIDYLSNQLKFRIEIKKQELVSGEQKNLYVINIYSPQADIDSDVIKSKFNLHVAKWPEIILPEGGLYKPGIDKYKEDVEHSSILIDLID